MQKSERDLLLDIHTKITVLETTFKKTKVLARISDLEDEQIAQKVALSKTHGMVKGAWFIIGIVALTVVFYFDSIAPLLKSAPTPKKLELPG